MRRPMNSFDMNLAIIRDHSMFDIETWRYASNFNDSGDKYLEDTTKEYDLDNPSHDEDEDGARVEVEVEGQAKANLQMASGIRDRGNDALIQSVLSGA